MRNTAIRYGLLFFAGLVTIFLSAYLLGLSDNYYLRFVNGIIHAVALYYGIKKLRLQEPQSLHNYVSGVSQGLYVGAVGSFLFAIFVFLFLYNAPGLMAQLQASTKVGAALTPITSGVIVFMEGIAVSLIGSYVLTRYVDARLEAKQGAGSVYAG